MKLTYSILVLLLKIRIIFYNMEIYMYNMYIHTVFKISFIFTVILINFN